MCLTVTSCWLRKTPAQQGHFMIFLLWFSEIGKDWGWHPLEIRLGTPSNEKFSVWKSTFIVWEMVSACCVLWNNEQNTADSCCGVCSKALDTPLVVIAVFHLISGLACLPWSSYSLDFYSLSLKTPSPRCPGLNWFRKDPSCLQGCAPVWFADLHHCCSKSLDLQFAFPPFSYP